jgi:hypothetical protein
MKTTPPIDPPMAALAPELSPLELDVSDACADVEDPEGVDAVGDMPGDVAVADGSYGC